MGPCDSCEKVKPDPAQDWTKFTTVEPTSIKSTHGSGRGRYILQSEHQRLCATHGSDTSPARPPTMSLSLALASRLSLT